MGFTAGGYNFEIAALSPKATRGNQTADVTSYVADRGGGLVSPAAAADAVSYTHLTLPTILLV